MAKIIGGKEITYYIHTNPSSFVLSQTDNTPLEREISINTSASAIDPVMDGIVEYRIEYQVGTNEYVYDLFSLQNINSSVNSSANIVETILLKTNDISNVPNGNYTGYITVMLMRRENNTYWEIVQTKDISIRLAISAPTIYKFEINKTEDTIHYTRGNNTSTIAEINIKSDTDYTITGPSHILVNGEPLPKRIDAGNVKLEFSTTASNQLIYGNNQVDVVFRKVNKILASLLLNVLVTNTNELEVSTDYLEFSHLEATGFSDWQTITVYSSESTINVAKPDWLEVVLDNKIEGIRCYKIRSITTDDISVGFYKGFILFSDNRQNAEITVDFEMYSYWNSEFDKELHFTKDKDFLQLSAYQRNENNYLKIELKGKVIDALNRRIEIENAINLYFFDNKAKFNLGNYIHDYYNLFTNQINYFNFHSSETQLKKMYDFARFEVKVTELNYETNDVVYWYNLPAQFYMMGHRPRTLNDNNTGLLSNLEGKICRATSKGKVLVHFLVKERSSQLKIFVNSELVEEISANQDDKLGIYSLYYDLSKLDLEAGNIVHINMANQSAVYQIIPETMFSNHILYIDYWGLPQIFEMCGAYNFESKITYHTHRNNENHLENLDSEKNIRFKWNTGYYFIDDIVRINEILNSKKCWMLREGNMIEIIPVSEKFSMIDSANYLYSEDLEFEINQSSYDDCFTS